MSAYSLYAVQPIHVRGKGEVAPKGYVSDAQRELMEAAQRGGTGNTLETFEGNSHNPDCTSQDPWGDLR